MEYDDRPDPAKRLREARIAAGFKHASDAAKRFGWNKTTYSQHEKGERGIGRAVGQYSKAFKVGPGWLLTGEGHGPHDNLKVIEPPKSLDEMIKDAPPEIREAVFDFVERLTKASS